ncbi:hypothetical protein N7510_011842 [Penicillium lagena]|uniref:uncharacterized protein n=1 Tax=Penicillium lagena TaxID=94218 RepID=UPI002541FC07|nr:uncharacterized protein N7510_011842 [Penicillium lagena]KAJ5598892.1 hypothetical protein N7510_011842 [Penicillium lagena]
MTPEITLYSWATPNGVKASIALEELGLVYRNRPVDIHTNEQKKEWFLKINPNGRIPALEDKDERVFESGAILLYLTDKYDLEGKISYRTGTPEYYEQLGWIMFQVGGIGPILGQANHFRGMPLVKSDSACIAGQDYSVERFTNESKRLLTVLESQLAGSPFLVGTKYTIADIINFTWVRRVPTILGADLAQWPAVKRWVDTIEQREAVKKGLSIVTTPF